METIAALATAPGKAGVAVIRISGARAFDAVGQLTSSLPRMREARLRLLKSPDGTVLDQALVLLFPAGESFTGEEVAELQLHGSPATVRAVLSALTDLPGIRQADPGEFTRRALENGQLDLSQVEGLADLLEAETEAQRKQALRVFSGAIGEIAELWRIKLIRAAALLEATIDFADEDVPTDVTPEVSALLSDVMAGLSAQLSGLSAAERIRDGFEVAIIGSPNVGKSTLINALAKRDAAIISDIPGTTRDIIEVKMDLAGLPVTILDTAGLRETDDAVEVIGVARARDRARSADLRIFLLMPGELADADLLEAEDIQLNAKSDLTETKDGISGKTGQGLTLLVERMTKTLQNRASTAGIATRERHRMALVTAYEHLDIAAKNLSNGAEFSEIGAEDIRTAIRALDSLVGRVDIEHILDEIFASFCLGK